MRDTSSIYSKPSFSDGIKFIPVSIIIIVLNVFWFVASDLFTYVGFIAIIFSIVSLLFLYRIKYQEFYGFVALVLLMLAFKTISSYITNNLANFGLYISLITGLLLSYLILNYDRNNLILKTFYYFMFVYVIFIFLVLLLGRDPNEIWQGSRNSSSQIFVITCSLFLIYSPALKFKMFLYFFIFLVCVLSMGRSGILTSTILLLASALQGYSFKSKRNKLLLFFLLSFSFFILFFNINIFLEFFNNYSGFDYLRAAGIKDSYRSDMSKEFFENYSLKVFLFGIDLSTLPYIASFNNNPHNGFIDLHAKIGVLAIILYCGVILAIFKLLLKREFVALLAITAMLLRFSTDSVSGILLIPLTFLCLYVFYLDRDFKKIKS